MKEQEEKQEEAEEETEEKVEESKPRKEESDKITEDIELKVQLYEVNSAIKDNISNDYTLAKLSEKDKLFITENYENAEYAKEILSRYARKGYYYKFDDKKGDWVRDKFGAPKQVYLTNDEKELIKTFANRIFNFFMIKPDILAILARNDDKNFLVKLLGKYVEEEKPVVFGTDDRSKLQKMSDYFTGNNPENYEQE